VLADPVAARRAALDLGASDVIDVAAGDMAEQLRPCCLRA
jgi:hypothetical protein